MSAARGRQDAGAQQPAAHPDAPRPSWLRENLEAIVVAIVLALLIRQYVTEAFVIPTGSMAPTLLGKHLEVECPNCGWRQPVTVNVLSRAVGSSAPANAAGTCPDCGRRYAVELPEDAFEAGTARIRCRVCGASVQLEPLADPIEKGDARTLVQCGNCRYRYEAHVRPRLWPLGEISRGDRILVNKQSYRFGSVHRYEIAVFKFPDQPSENFIKRIVGLPGETLDVKAGDLWVNGKVARKPLALQRTVWQPVYDTGYPEKDDGAESPRGAPWRDRAGAWRATGDRRGFVATPPDGGVAVREYARPIDNWTSYNVFTNAGGSELVRDVRAVLDMHCEPPGWFGVELETDEDRFRVRLEPQSGRVLVERDGEPFAQASFAPRGATLHCEVARADERLIVRVEGEPVLVEPFTADSTRCTRSVLRLLAGGGPVTFHRVRISRDLHYLATIRRPEPYRKKFGTRIFPFRVPEGHYFAMGDNAPNSTDSRVWGPIPAGHLVGRAFCVFWPALPYDWAVRRLR